MYSLIIVHWYSDAAAKNNHVQPPQRSMGCYCAIFQYFQKEVINIYFQKEVLKGGSLKRGHMATCD